jgi:S1-C subfamily serine protease
MKLRIFLLAAALAGGFVLLTSVGRMTLHSRTTERAPVLAAPAAIRAAGLSIDEQNNIDIYKTVNPATVNITSTILQRNWFYDVVPVRDAGSGFFIDDKGTILTNNHVISGRAPRIQVSLHNGGKYDAKVISRDVSNDLALIRIEPRSKVPFVTLADSDKVQVGQKVLAIGNPFALDGTLTTGVISSIGRDLVADDNGRKLEGLIQTDAAINPGNSGGPLLDSQGAVIGVNTMIYTNGGNAGNIGIGFAMPINRVRNMLEDYRAGRTFGIPWLGVTTYLISADLATELSLPESGGLLIQEIREGSPAEEAGLRGPRRYVQLGNYVLGIGGDLIVAIEGNPVNRVDSLTKVLARKRPGEKLELTVFRNGRQIKATVTLGTATE